MRVLVMCVFIIIILALAEVLSAGAAARAADGDFVRITLLTPAPSPFSFIRYEVSQRGRITTAVHRRALPGYDEVLHGMGLVTPSEADAIWKLCAETDALGLSDAGPGTRPDDGGTFAKAKRRGRARHTPWPGLTWKVEVSLGGKDHTFRVTDPINRVDRRYEHLFAAVVHKVEEVAGDLPFRNVFFPANDMGWIDLASIPVAHVWADGFDTKLQTPLYGYELSAGVHEIRLRSRGGRYDRVYRVRIEPSGTTQLNVDLR